jgi:prepilin-type N-terminal cleavage/methylation domain-containing protein
MKKKEGFTLIELLVVVLIIGILAAIALPQYQKAVNKAKFMKVAPLVKQIKNAMEFRYLSTGSYSGTGEKGLYSVIFDDLDINIPCQNSVWAGNQILDCNGEFILRAHMYGWYTDYAYAEFSKGDMFDKTLGGIRYVIWYDHPFVGSLSNASLIPPHSGKSECWARKESEKLNDICRYITGWTGEPLDSGVYANGFNAYPIN